MNNEKNREYFSCNDLLLLNSMTGSVLLAGKTNLWKQVKRVNIAEVPDIINWVKPNEFLITTGYPFKDNEEELVNILPKLMEKGVVALGIKPKRFINSISQKVINKAKELDFPLIELGPMAIFSDIVHDVMENVLAKEMTNFYNVQKKMEKVLNSIIEGKTIEESLEIIEEQTKQVAFIIDWENDVIVTEKSIKYTEKLNGDQWKKIKNESKELKAIELTIEDNIVNAHIIPMNIGISDFVTMVLIEESEILQESDITVILRVCQVLSLELKNSSDIKKLKEKYKNRFLYDWIANAFNNKSDICVAANSNGYKIEPNEKYRLAIVDIFEDDNKRVFTDSDLVKVKRVINFLDENIFATLYESKLIIIFKEITSNETEQLLSKELKKIKNITGNEMINFYLSEPNDIEYIPKAYKEAINIYRISKRCNINHQIITYEKIGIFSVLALLPDNHVVKEYKDKFLKPIKEYDENHNGCLLDTLKVYFEKKCNARLTADELFIHYNTISYRLEKIKSILDMDIDEVEIQLQLQLALKLDLMKSECDKNE